MPNIFVDHKDRWLALAESDSDFAVQFIRAWIPFNAWYCNAYPHNNNKDRPTLDEMKSDSNLFRTRILAHLNGTDSESLQFKVYLGQLHLALERYYIPDAANRITFTSLFYRANPQTVFPHPRPVRGLEYKAEILSNGHIRAVIVESAPPNSSRFSYTHTKYDIPHLQAYPQYAALTGEQQAVILNCVREINPRRTENLIKTNRRDSIDCGGILFINNPNLLSQALIELLYRLRCILFHGEIQPSKDNLSVYEPAYNILRLLLKSLK